MKKLTVKLKQHTPLIHFQHEQYGATLRASEVKPKLDRYIIQRVFGNDFDKCKSYLIGYDVKKPDALKEKFEQGYSALNYKINISIPNEKVNYLLMNGLKDYKKKDEIRGKPFLEKIVNGEKKKYLAKFRDEDSRKIFDLDSYPLYFGNMNADYDNPDEYKKMSFTKSCLDCKFLFLNDVLFDKMFKEETVLSDFFMNNNFGTRQSKGFGSFYIHSSDSFYVEPKSKYSFRIDDEKLKDGEDPLTDDNIYNKIFSVIELFYKTIRSGINLKDKNGYTAFYFKSLSFLYCRDRLKAKWDKKKVKEEFYNLSSPGKNNDSLVGQLNKYDSDILTIDLDKCYDIRDLLGFSINEKWLSYGDSIRKEMAVKNVRGEYDYPELDKERNVTRMQSPILFKPICSDGFCRVYIVFQDDKVGLEKFKEYKKICVYSTKVKGENNLKKRFQIDIPKCFSGELYFDYIFNILCFDVNSHVENEYKKHRYFAVLDGIYTQLKENSKK